LKDVQQLFMGTGVGRTSYSIMAQGNITQILSSRPEDRRLIFDEAAGITKFKAQKKESLKKLEYTEQNLLRVADLIREVKRQIGSLQRQAGKARRYKQIMSELEHLDCQLARHQYDVLNEEIKGRQTQIERLRLDMEIGAETVLRGENEIGQLRERLSEIEHQIGQTQQQGMELKSQVDRHESRIHFNEERLRELEAQNSRATGDIAQAEERRLAAEQELEQLNQRLAASTAALAEHQRVLEERRAALQGLEEQLRSRQENLRQKQAEAFSSSQQLSRARNEINALDLQKEGNAARLEKLSSEKVQLEEERLRLEQRIEQFQTSVAEEILHAQSHRGTVEERQMRLKEIQAQLNGATQELDQLLRQQAEKRSRLSVLEQLQSEHEGFDSGVLSVLKAGQNVQGSLPDKIRVPDPYVTAIETALGMNLQLVLTAQPEAARQIVDDLRNNRRGRASIAALDLLTAAAGEEGDLTRYMTEFGTAAGAVSALGVVECEATALPLLQRLLGRTVILPDLAAASVAWTQCGGTLDFVTLTGECLNRHGVFTGGAASGNNQGKSISILARKNQIAELQKAVSGLQEQITESSRRKGALLSEQTELQASIQEAQQMLRSQEVAIATHQGEFNALQNSQKLLRHKIETVVYEISSLAAQEQEGLRKREGLSARVGELESREHELQASVSELGASLETLRQERESANAALTEVKVNLATQQQLCAASQAQIRPLQQRIGELTHLADQRRSEIASFLARKGQAEAEIAESRQKIESLTHQREQINRQTTDLEGQKEAQARQVAESEDKLREARNRLGEWQQQRSAIEIELAQRKMSVDNLRARVQEKYQRNLDDIRSECITITLADEGAAKVQTLTPEEMAASGGATDWNAVTEQVTVLQKRIDEMGPVNLVAIEEYEETEQRYNFLTKQNDDLVQAKAQLLDVISRINTQTQQMFKETFDKIRANFREMFVEIFGGGKADLILVNEGDVLESGIDIMARPPGKQLQSITLLSGGEQTMTAVALLFSIYQVKPSPFCVLDELDAPLDESNINRFLRVLKRFLTQSQFIMITHNKRTIAIADVLYGVTMQEHGVSKIVGVKFHKADDDGDEANKVPSSPTGSKPLVPMPA
jgi:chromosome segregation protein